jgi:hypothetical protein
MPSEARSKLVAQQRRWDWKSGYYFPMPKAGKYWDASFYALCIGTEE